MRILICDDDLEIAEQLNDTLNNANIAVKIFFFSKIIP